MVHSDKIDGADGIRIALIIEEGGPFASGFVSDILERFGAKIVAVFIFRPEKPGFDMRAEVFKRRRIVGNMALTRLILKVLLRRAQAMLPVWLVGPARKTLSATAAAYGYVPKVITRLDDPASLEHLRQLNADVFFTSLSARANSEFIGIPKLACLNKHASLLPSYGGLMPVFQAVSHGEERVGITIHEMSPRLDEGKVLWQKAVPIDSGSTIWSLSERAYGMLAEGLETAIEVLQAREAPVRIVPAPAESYFSTPTDEDWRLFAKRGIKFS